MIAVSVLSWIIIAVGVSVVPFIDVNFYGVSRLVVLYLFIFSNCVLLFVIRFAGMDAVIAQWSVLVDRVLLGDDNLSERSFCGGD